MTDAESGDNGLCETVIRTLRVVDEDHRVIQEVDSGGRVLHIERSGW